MGVSYWSHLWIPVQWYRARIAVIFSNASLSSIFLSFFWVSLFIFQAFLMQKLSFVGRYFRDVALLHQRCLKTMEHDVVNKLKPCGCHIRWCYVYVCNHRWLMAIRSRYYSTKKHIFHEDLVEVWPMDSFSNHLPVIWGDYWSAYQTRGVFPVK